MTFSRCRCVPFVINISFLFFFNLSKYYKSQTTVKFCKQFSVSSRDVVLPGTSPVMSPAIKNMFDIKKKFLGGKNSPAQSSPKIKKTTRGTSFIRLHRCLSVPIQFSSSLHLDVVFSPWFNLYMTQSQQRFSQSILYYMVNVNEVLDLC